MTTTEPTRPALQLARRILRFVLLTTIAAAFWLCFAQALELLYGMESMPHLYRGTGATILFGASAASLFALLFAVDFRLSSGTLDDLNTILAFAAGAAMAPSLYCLIFYGPATAALVGFFGVAGLLFLGVCCLPFLLLLYLMGVR